MAKKKKEIVKKKKMDTVEELLDSIEELYTRYWEREGEYVTSLGFEIGEVYTLARILKKERDLDNYGGMYENVLIF